MGTYIRVQQEAQAQVPIKEGQSILEVIASAPEISNFVAKGDGFVIIQIQAVYDKPIQKPILPSQAKKLIELITNDEVRLVGKHEKADEPPA